MNIIFLNWASLCAQDTCLALSNLGHHVNILQLSEMAHNEVDEEFMKKLEQRIHETDCDVVFSVNYFPTASLACQHTHCHYLSWIYDNPQLKVYDQTAVNDCNHIFTFDSHMASQLQARGVQTVTYAPMAANVKRLTSPVITSTCAEKYSCDISFVGSLYDEKHNFYNRLITKADDSYLQGYLDGIIEAQSQVYGYNFLAELLTSDIIERIRKYMPFSIDEGSFVQEAEVYADYYLARRLAFIDRVKLLYTLGQFFQVHLYTHGTTDIGNVKNCGTIDYNEEMPYLFRLSKINLNCSLRSIKNGIPLRAMDILGCGGFLMTNFQEDFLLHFEEGVHFESYSSLPEALDKCHYYLAHEPERQKIAAQALELMYKEHTFEVRLQQMLNSI